MASKTNDVAGDGTTTATVLARPGTSDVVSLAKGVSRERKRSACGNLAYTWRIIPFSKWLVTPIYKPFRPFGRGTTPVRGLTNHFD